MCWNNLAEVGVGKDVASTYMLRPHLVERLSLFQSEVGAMIISEDEVKEIAQTRID